MCNDFGVFWILFHTLITHTCYFIIGLFVQLVYAYSGIDDCKGSSEIIFIINLPSQSNPVTIDVICSRILLTCLVQGMWLLIWTMLRYAVIENLFYTLFEAGAAAFLGFIWSIIHSPNKYYPDQFSAFCLFRVFFLINVFLVFIFLE